MNNIQATVIQINPRNSRKMERVGYGNTQEEAFAFAIAGRKDWELVSAKFRTVEHAEVKDFTAEEIAEMQKTWSNIHYGK